MALDYTYDELKKIEARRPKRVGWLPIPFAQGKAFAVEGGPFDGFSGTGFGLCLEVRSVQLGNASAVVDIPDYSIPDPVELDNALARFVDALYKGRSAYIGCMGGFGRTGTAMACLVAAFGVANPIEYVRSYYCKRAVETPEQKQFVLDTWLPKTRKRIFINGWKYRLGMTSL